MKKRAFQLAVINSFLISQFLFFIDEGNYNFRWMTNMGNWLIFLIYLALITGILFLINVGLGKIKTNENIILGVNLIVFPTLLLVIFYNL
ncbi:hypothetical protein [Flavobacterium saliperosum]|uniref:Uncharacterized protein n=2 Tax=Flavobacterium saliperosum TaxID=329186 RepID=A0A1G4VIB8_9FLAO|nr:hypothetical protein [Flavobacterium saliperosum]SCX07259.1 hypothetical protein SAMN02927925_01133 [Flavobacterium saliperosum]